MTSSMIETSKQARWTTRQVTLDCINDGVASASNALLTVQSGPADGLSIDEAATVYHAAMRLHRAIERLAQLTETLRLRP